VGSSEQLTAGDVNKDGQVDNSDANAIIYRTLNAKWPELPATQTRRSLRDGKEPTILLGLTDMEGISGGEVKTTLSIENVSDLNAMNLSIFYDPSVVKSVVKVEKVGLIAGSSVSMSYYDKGNGALNIGIDSQNSINGSGELVTITLQLASGGTQRTAPITIAAGYLYDAVGRNFAISALQRDIESRPAQVIRTDVPPPVEVETPKPPVQPDEPVDEPVEKPVQPEMIPLSDLLPKEVAENKAVHGANGYFLDDQDNPIMGVVITIDGKMTVTDETGYWMIVGLEAGEHTVTMNQNGQISTITCTISSRSSCRVDVGGSPEEIIAIPPSIPSVPTEPVEQGKYMILGTVKTKSNVVVSDALMKVVTSTGEKTTVTDGAGNWEIDGLTEGKYVVTGTANNFTCLADDIALGNNMYRQEVVCKQVSSLKVTAKSIPTRAIYQGENLGYLLTVINASDKVATGVVLANLNLPEGVKVASLTPLDGGECNLETASCTLPDLTPGTTARAELVLSDVPAGQFHHIVRLKAVDFPTDQVNTWKQVKPYLSTTVGCTPNPVEMQKQLHCTATAELSSFAPDPTATGVKLQLNLPKGVELKNATTSHGECDTSVAGKVLCPLKDLSIASSDQVSKATVDVDFQLVDPGLLVLTTEAKLTATNYAEHIARNFTRIAIPKDTKIDLVIAVDTTYSMNGIINGIIKAIKEFIQTHLTDPTVTPPLTVLMGYKDDVRLVIPPTRDMNVVLAALQALKIEDGGTCPEASVEALNLAADYLRKDGVILGATNAPAHPEADVEALKKRLVEMDADGAKIFFIYQPECDVTSDVEQAGQGLGDIAVPTFPTQ